MMIIIIIIL